MTSKNRLPALKPNKLNLGCGKFRIEGHIGIDIKDHGQEVVWDLRNGIPFPDESVDDVYSCHFLEHLTDEEVIPLKAEIRRVLKKGDRWLSQTPKASHPTAFYFNHRSFWNKAKIEPLKDEGWKIVKNEETKTELHFILEKL